MRKPRPSRDCCSFQPASFHHNVSTCTTPSRSTARVSAVIASHLYRSNRVASPLSPCSAACADQRIIGVSVVEMPFRPDRLRFDDVRFHAQRWKRNGSTHRYRCEPRGCGYQSDSPSLTMVSAPEAISDPESLFPLLTRQKIAGAIWIRHYDYERMSTEIIHVSRAFSRTASYVSPDRECHSECCSASAAFKAAVCVLAARQRAKHVCMSTACRRFCSVEGSVEQ